MRFLTKKIEQNESDVIVSYIYEDAKNESEVFEYLDKLSNNELSKQIYEYKTIKGTLAETFKFSLNKDKKAIIVGLGKKEKLTRQKFAQCIASAGRCAKTIQGAKSIGFELLEHKTKCDCNYSNFEKHDCAKIIFTSARIGLYEFNKYLSDKK